MARFIVAVTGGIASGKSAVTAAFADLGIVVADADIAARSVVEAGQPALDEISRSFGPEFVSDGQLNRAALRELVFQTPEAKKKTGVHYSPAHPPITAARMQSGDIRLRHRRHPIIG